MKNLAFLLFASLALAGCQNSRQAQQLKDLSVRDSLLLLKAQEKDSTIMAYIHSLNDIQDNLNAIKAKENVISMSKGKGEGGSQSATIVSDIKALDDLILKDHKDIAALETKLKSSNKQDAEMKKMIANLNSELDDREAEIASLQTQLSKSNDSVRLVVGQFNDSLNVVRRQRSQISVMTTNMNTVYYAFGTYKELKKEGVLMKEGKFAGLGGVSKLKPDFNTAYFTSAMIPDLHTIPLNSKFEKLVTNHPAGAYKVVPNGKTDNFIITDPASFWSTGKYLVIIVNEEGSNKNVTLSTSQASLSESAK